MNLLKNLYKAQGHFKDYCCAKIMFLQVIEKAHLVLWHYVEASDLVVLPLIILHDEHAVLDHFWDHHLPTRVDPLDGLNFIGDLKVVLRVFQDEVVLALKDLTVALVFQGLEHLVLVLV